MPKKPLPAADRGRKGGFHDFRFSEAERQKLTTQGVPEACVPALERHVSWYRDDASNKRPTSTEARASIKHAIDAVEALEHWLDHADAWTLATVEESLCRQAGEDTHGLSPRLKRLRVALWTAEREAESTVTRGGDASAEKALAGRIMHTLEESGIQPHQGDPFLTAIRVCMEAAGKRRSDYRSYAREALARDGKNTS